MGIGGVFFEGEVEDGDFFVDKGVVEVFDDMVGEVIMSVFVYFDDLVLVFIDFGEIYSVGEVDKVENVFFEVVVIEIDISY